MDRTRPRPHRPLRLLRLLVAAAACVGTLALGAPGADAATVPAGMVGMNDWGTPSDQAIQTTSRAGIKSWRAPLFWYLVEGEPGRRDWTEYDRLVTTSAREGASLLMVIAGCPRWACSEISGPPTSPSALDAHHLFVRDAVQRYGHGGSFWREHPELPYHPVTDWQVWNEVNSREFWKPGPNAADYARFLRDESAAIRGADPGATVVLSGLTNYGQVPLVDFLRQLYAQPGFRSSFDVAALHAYAGDDRAVGRLLDAAHRVMADAGDGARATWITEMGWGTTTPTLHTPTTLARQAELLRSTYDMLIGCRSRWNLGRAYWFAIRDIDPPAGEADYAGFHTGLFDTAGRPKPAWSAMQEYPEGGQLPDGCPLDGPRARALDTAIVAPKRVASRRRVRLRLVASQPRVRFQCRLLRARRARSVRHARWRGCRRHYRSRALRRGRYVLQVRAVARDGRIDRSPARARLVVRRKRKLIVRVSGRRLARSRLPAAH
jgi:polysaccharide biosynthesis protein PslG